MNNKKLGKIQAAWRARYETAQALMEQRKTNPRTLVEIAAQHPLENGIKPNEEFRSRLERGKYLFEEYAIRGHAEIYVPGSRHVFLGQADQISLSNAGRAYLVQHGVPSDAIRGEDLNQRYKGTDGVYCSADECFVAASYFKDADFGTLVSVVSPGQMIRKTLHYIQFGVIPLNFTAPVLNGFHDYLDELFEMIPRILTTDSTLQGYSDEARQLRAERKPPAPQGITEPVTP